MRMKPIIYLRAKYILMVIVPTDIILRLFISCLIGTSQSNNLLKNMLLMLNHSLAHSKET